MSNVIQKERRERYEEKLSENETVEKERCE